jgi:hypothetical protein
VYDISKLPRRKGNLTPETLLKNMHKKVLNRQKQIESELLKRSKHYADMLEERLIKHKAQETSKIEKVDIYDKAFFLNEEMNDLKEQLEKVNKDITKNKE